MVPSFSDKCNWVTSPKMESLDQTDVSLEAVICIGGAGQFFSVQNLTSRTLQGIQYSCSLVPQFSWAAKEYDRLDGLKIRNLFLTVLEDVSLRSRFDFLFAWHADFSLCMHIPGVSFSSQKDTSNIELEPHFMTSFNLFTSLKSLSPSIVTLGVRTSTYVFGGTKFSPYTCSLTAGSTNQE